MPTICNMTQKEKNALLKSGLILGKLNYRNYSNCILVLPILLKYNKNTWPIVPTNPWECHHNADIGDNTCILTFLNHEIGLSIDINGEKVGVSLSHPLSKYWLSILQPIWDEQNKGKCKTCHGTGWDGIGYILTCVDCKGTGKT